MIIKISCQKNKDKVPKLRKGENLEIIPYKEKQRNLSLNEVLYPPNNPLNNSP